MFAIEGGARHPWQLSAIATAIATWLGALSRSHGTRAHHKGGANSGEVPKTAQGERKGCPCTWKTRAPRGALRAPRGRLSQRKGSVSLCLPLSARTHIPCAEPLLRLQNPQSLWGLLFTWRLVMRCQDVNIAKPVLYHNAHGYGCVKGNTPAQGHHTCPHPPSRLGIAPHINWSQASAQIWLLRPQQRRTCCNTWFGGQSPVEQPHTNHL